MLNDAQERKPVRVVDILIGMAVLGSIWGLAEVVLGGAIKAAGIPLRSAIVTGVAVGIMAVGLGAFRRPSMLIGMAIVAVLGKQLVVPILHMSFMCRANSCIAVGFQGIALAGVATLVGQRLRGNRVAQVATGASAALVAASAFYFVGLRVAPCESLLSFAGPLGFPSFLATKGSMWAAFSAILFPLGYRIGENLRESVWAWGTARPLLYYIASGVSVALCWIVSAMATASGL